MHCELKEDKNAYKSFPVGILQIREGDHPIRIYFNHYDSFEQAYDKWNERKKRINYNNLYVVGCDHYGTPYSQKNFREFNSLPYNHKIIITGGVHPKSSTIFSVNGCEVNGHLGDWWNRINNVRHSRIFEEWNYVKFLNQKD